MGVATMKKSAPVEITTLRQSGSGVCWDKCEKMTVSQSHRHMVYIVLCKIHRNSCTL